MPIHKTAILYQSLTAPTDDLMYFITASTDLQCLSVASNTNCYTAIEQYSIQRYRSATENSNYMNSKKSKHPQSSATFPKTIFNFSESG